MLRSTLAGHLANGNRIPFDGSHPDRARQLATAAALEGLELRGRPPALRAPSLGVHLWRGRRRAGWLQCVGCNLALFHDHHEAMGVNAQRRAATPSIAASGAELGVGGEALDSDPRAEVSCTFFQKNPVYGTVFCAMGAIPALGSFATKRVRPAWRAEWRHGW